MQLAFNIQVREDKEYLLSKEDSKKVMDKAFELVKGHKLKSDTPYLSFYVEYATRLLLDNGEIEGTLINTETEEEITWVRKAIE